MLKTIGIVILILSGYAGGYCKSLKLIQKVRFIEEYLEFITFFQNEIKYTGKCLSEITKKCTNTGLFYSYINKCNEYISEGHPFPTAWKRAFNNIQRELSISSEFSDILKNFGSCLGSSDINGQLSYCKYNYELAIPYLETATEEKKTRVKLYSVLGTCLGIAAALFFI